MSEKCRLIVFIYLTGLYNFAKVLRFMHSANINFLCLLDVLQNHWDFPHLGYGGSNTADWFPGNNYWRLFAAFVNIQQRIEFQEDY